jgi:hypothetical protein
VAEAISLREGVRVAVLLDLECDHCGRTDPALKGAYRIGPLNLARKRRQARRLGWQCRSAGKGRWTDLCPGCKPPRAQPTARGE